MLLRLSISSCDLTENDFLTFWIILSACILSEDRRTGWHSVAGSCEIFGCIPWTPCVTIFFAWNHCWDLFLLVLSFYGNITSNKRIRASIQVWLSWSGTVTRRDIGGMITNYWKNYLTNSFLWHYFGIIMPYKQLFKIRRNFFYDFAYNIHLTEK